MSFANVRSARPARMLRTGGVAALREKPNGEIEIVPMQ